MRFVIPMACAAALTACTFSEPGPETSESNNDNAVATLTLGSGQVTVADKPVVKGPTLRDDARTFSMNGVPLYPGSKIIGQRFTFGGSRGNAMHLSFESPAAAAAVREWLKPRLEKAGYSLIVDGTGLTGTDNRRRQFLLKLADSGGLTRGEVVAGR